MKSDKLKLFIRKMVREEVAMAIHEVITELKQPIKKQVNQIEPKKKIVEKSFSSNSVLNDILNETAESNEWQTMGGGVYDSSRAHEVMQKQYGQQSMDMEAAAGIGVDLNKVNASTTDFLNKDYSKVLKKSYEKRGKG